MNQRFPQIFWRYYPGHFCDHQGDLLLPSIADAGKGWTECGDVASATHLLTHLLPPSTADLNGFSVVLAIKPKKLDQFVME